MKYHLCTFFNRNYLYKGLAQYKSLEKTSSNFTIWILCMDNTTYNLLSKLIMKNAKLVKLEEIENKELLKVKKDRSEAEYCWTVKPTFMKYIFNKNKNINKLLYVDADIAFFQDVRKVFNEAGEKSIGIAPHNFTDNIKKRVKRTGKFNAGVVYLKKDREGLRCLERWRKQCIKWCYWRVEDGKLGDQMYLDEWPIRYKNIKIFTHKGVNLAPWSEGKYSLTKNNSDIYVDDKLLIFYHFHQFKILANNKYDRSSGYKLTNDVIELIYKPYEKLIKESIMGVKRIDSKFRYGIEKQSRINNLKVWFMKKGAHFYWKLIK